MANPNKRNNRPLDDADLSDEDERNELSKVDTHDTDADDLLYGSDESDFDLEYYDNEEEDYDEPDAIQFDDD